MSGTPTKCPGTSRLTQARAVMVDCPVCGKFVAVRYGKLAYHKAANVFVRRSTS